MVTGELCRQTVRSEPRHPPRKAQRTRRTEQEAHVCFSNGKNGSWCSVSCDSSRGCSPNSGSSCDFQVATSAAAATERSHVAIGAHLSPSPSMRKSAIRTPLGVSPSSSKKQRRSCDFVRPRSSKSSRCDVATDPAPLQRLATTYRGTRKPAFANAATVGLSGDTPGTRSRRARPRGPRSYTAIVEKMLAVTAANAEYTSSGNGPYSTRFSHCNPSCAPSGTSASSARTMWRCRSLTKERVRIHHPPFGAA